MSQKNLQIRMAEKEWCISEVNPADFNGQALMRGLDGTRLILHPALFTSCVDMT